jgi:hypothetical protein
VIWIYKEILRFKKAHAAMRIILGIERPGAKGRPQGGAINMIYNGIFMPKGRLE